MAFQDILIFGSLLNVTAGLGAFGFAWIDDLVGAKFTILASVAALTGLGAAIMLVDSQLWFYVLGCGIVVFIGPPQTASRPCYARILPPQARKSSEQAKSVEKRVDITGRRIITTKNQ